MHECRRLTYDLLIYNVSDPVLHVDSTAGGCIPLRLIRSEADTHMDW